MAEQQVPQSEEPTRKRFLMRLWVVVRDGMPSFGRYRRYARALLPPVIAIWALAAAYLFLAPVKYTSQMTLILPGSGIGVSMNVDQIGQASAVSNSAFSSPTLSPTENYKRLLMADITRRHAAELAKMPAAKFPEPVVKLTDQTNLIDVSLDGPTPQAAKERTEALRRAFLDDLNRLRADEAAEREKVDQVEIERLQLKAHESQARLLAFQNRSGLVSTEQFNARVSGLAALHDRQRQAMAQLSQERASATRLAHALEAGVDTARMAMVLKADPQFQGLLLRYATLATQLSEKTGTLGNRHATVLALAAQTSALRESLVRRGSAISGLDRTQILQFADLSVSDGRSQLFQSLVSQDSQAAGTDAAVGEMERQISQEADATAKMTQDASTLADLNRDLRVADAVLSSALARLDTNKSDPFASYPLVQTLEAPSLPVKKTSPSPLLAIAGALGGTILLSIGFGLAWIRQPIIQRLLQKN